MWKNKTLQDLSWFQRFWYNFNNKDKLIKCKYCGLVQYQAYDWDYQICSCGRYLYDFR